MGVGSVTSLFCLWSTIDISGFFVFVFFLFLSASDHIWKRVECITLGECFLAITSMKLVQRKYTGACQKPPCIDLIISRLPWLPVVCTIDTTCQQTICSNLQQPGC